MKPSFTQARSRLALLIVLFAAATACAQTPTGEDIMRSARLNPMSQQADLSARLRNDDGKTPFTISLHDGVVRYRFAEPDQEIQLTLGEDSSELREQSGGKSAAVKPARYDEKVRGSAITYEDLALKLLYWPKPKLVGEEAIRGFKCWKIEVHAPKGQSQYAAARIWISESSGAVLRIEGYGADGRVIKRFEMISGQKLDGRWMLKTMRVDCYDPQTHKVVDSARTYLEVLGNSKP
ncbi:MAG: outer membrane lipoprotein-sorting protein [Chthoniobacterales bacterium]